MSSVSVCLPSDVLLQHLLSYLGFSYLGGGVSLHGCSSKAQPLLLTLLTATLPDLHFGIAPLGPPVPRQPRLLGCGVGPPGHHPWPRSCGCSSLPLPLASGLGAWGSSSRPSCTHTATAPWMWGWSSWPPPLASGVGLLLPAVALGLGLRGVG